ncbi:MAG: hypothetical protein AAF388_23150, partial [Bacteroidota bacterium]
MLKKYKQILSDLRIGQISLQDFLYKEEKDGKGYSIDKNSIKRFQLLIALQFDRKSDDEVILVELFKAEIERHKKSTSQGLHPALRLNAFLVSQYLNPEYAILHLEAKRASFDTHGGLDYQFLVSAGISETYQFFQVENHELAGEFYGYMGESVDRCFVSESELLEWWNSMKREYPEELIINDIRDEIDLAIALNEMEILKEKIKEWSEGTSSWNKLDLIQLSFYQSLVEDVSG